MPGGEKTIAVCSVLAPTIVAIAAPNQVVSVSQKESKERIKHTKGMTSHYNVAACSIMFDIIQYRRVVKRFCVIEPKLARHGCELHHVCYQTVRCQVAV